MHCILLGVVKSMMKLWIQTTNKREKFYLNKGARQLLNSRILKVKICNFITRKPRSLNDMPLFKASEYRTYLLYILPIVLKGILPNTYYDHLCLLSSAVYKLLKEKIPNDSLKSIEGDLIKFVVDFERLYGAHRVTMNLHRLLHIVDSVRNSGPLWATSVFHFESNNGRLLNFVNGTQDVLLQIAAKYNLSTGIDKKFKTKNIGNTFKNPIKIVLTEEQIRLFQEIGLETDQGIKAYASMNRFDGKYSSIHYLRAKRTIDYFIKIDDIYAKILFYFEYSGIKLMMIERLVIIKKFHQYTIVIEDGLDVVDIGKIKTKVICITLNNCYYIVEQPNKFEKD